ncbi:aflatoxin biosynthesis ketoreductase-like protein nor-1 [Hyaloscypha variabilis F]|uniref:Aflatoxin biosynthesis ketoreductase-like protein nor-1 n=1 Tax=Hyaloscypha variabilis (strain UAMH 11265 / GT02V1 / F) TaxID=1149755 RepID=A0A2J6R0U2_HYAVF|nr:aflatoxin biosynthesis ketoreductase-like protein nor-1 [Hyaloscypha variabilis F]
MDLTYVITGAGHGIGKGILEVLIARPSTTVIAAVRDVPAATKSLSTVTVGKDSKLIIVKIDSTSDTDPFVAVDELKSSHGITHVDVLLSNAGLLDIIAPVLKKPAEQVRRHFEVNTIAPLLLLQAFFPLLEKSEAPKFLIITSSIGTITNMENQGAANYLARKVVFENPKLVSMAFNPGWVQTDMGNGAAKGVGMEGLITLFDAASLKKTGAFTGVEGDTLPW